MIIGLGISILIMVIDISSLYICIIDFVIRDKTSEKLKVFLLSELSNLQLFKVACIYSILLCDIQGVPKRIRISLFT